MPTNVIPPALTIEDALSAHDSMRLAMMNALEKCHLTPRFQRQVITAVALYMAALKPRNTTMIRPLALYCGKAKTLRQAL